jgi:hypothetical protein
LIQYFSGSRFARALLDVAEGAMKKRANSQKPRPGRATKHTLLARQTEAGEKQIDLARLHGRSNEETEIVEAQGEQILRL